MTLFTAEDKKNLADNWHGQVVWDCPLDRYTSLHTGGPADGLFTADSIDQLRWLIRWLLERKIPFRMIGKGSNILVSDEGLAGAAIILGEDFRGISEVDKQTNIHLVQVGAACFIQKLINYCIEKGTSGLEFLAGIPGTVGGVIMMNGGAWGREISEVLQSASFMTESGEIRTLSRDEMEFSYRKLSVSGCPVVLSGTFMLTAAERDRVNDTCREYMNRRKDKQPIQEASAGSFFKNPPGQAAGYLIEQAGLKGRKVGGAMVSLQHANFLINTGNATSADFIALVGEIQQQVKEKFGIMLEPEVHILKRVQEER
jgi:UDP-N-acetylmuramate dehydrogenase